MTQYLLIAYAVVSLLTFFAYWSDKRRAKKNRWRKSESSLLCLGFLGGAVGALLGMVVFRHKTRKWYFWVVNLISLYLQAVLLVGMRMVE
jgi:uncharacterized membrane protein YsdA (DUF1294 family)